MFKQISGNRPGGDPSPTALLSRQFQRVGLSVAEAQLLCDQSGKLSNANNVVSGFVVSKLGGASQREYQPFARLGELVGSTSDFVADLRCDICQMVKVRARREDVSDTEQKLGGFDWLVQNIGCSKSRGLGPNSRVL